MIKEKLQVMVPTKEEYIKVVQCMLDNGNAWANGEKEVLGNYWNKHKNKTIACLDFNKDNTITYGCFLRDIKVYNSQEFLDKYDTIFHGDSTWKKHEEDNLVKDNNKNMNIKKFAKTLTLSKEDKLLRECGLQNDCGDFTEEARELVINKLVEERKDYLVEIATKMKEECGE